MTADNDPAAPSGPGAADAEGPADELEDWLSGLRTDEFPLGETGEEPVGDLPGGPAVEQPSAGGRHRAPE